ncbi:hypothetical protein MLD38_011889 [Melastoma candidum]|uniref:Uncharacterized protein n=1 Tax=Melastoma candidum TaxID=119954 RepID=A0ACB9R4M9_9MYRT|nr:hypothetical protein MLD38_011889 [Melastoma candidum]
MVGGLPPRPLETATTTTPVKPRPATIKFLCSYGGRIVPRHPDATLRYVGGVTRLLSVPRSLSFSELLVKMGELCGAAVSVRCQLPTEDLDALVSITCDDDLANLIEEYDRAAVPKIRAFLSLPKLAKPTSPPSSLTSSSSPGSSLSSGGATGSSLSSPLFAKPAAIDRCLHQFMARRPRQSPLSPSPCLEKDAGKMLNRPPLVYG